MIRRSLAVLLLALSATAAWSAEIVTKAGRHIEYEDLIIALENPKLAFTVKTRKGTEIFKLSEIDLTSLDRVEQREVATFIKNKKAQRIVLKNDEWVNRNEMLLREDPRFASAKKLVRVGDSLVDVKNTTDGLVTIGVRVGAKGEKGYELSIDAGKTKGLQVPDGKMFYYMAFEAPDGKRLVVQRSKDIELAKTHLSVEIVVGDKPEDVAGFIDIPEEYQGN